MVTVVGTSLALPSNLLPFAALLTLAANVALWALLAVAALHLSRLLLRWVTRYSSTRLDDAIVGIVRRPLLLLLLSYGVLSSWEAAFGASAVSDALQRLHSGLLIVLAAYVAWRILYEVVIAHLKPIVEESDSQADDIIVPILGRVGPVVIIIALANAVVAIMGGNLASLLTGLGLMGLVLGYLFQEPLQGLFSGTYMVLDNPFRQDDLLLLDDGTICQVRQIGIRVTQLYDVKRHVLLYLPNSRLAAAKIVNVTKPSVELRTVLNVTMDRHGSPRAAAALLVEACNAHENILGLWPHKRAAILRRQDAYRAEYARLSANPSPLPADEAQMEHLARQVERLDGEITRLGAEHRLRRSGEDFSRELLGLVRLSAQLQDGGLLDGERDHLKQRIGRLMDRFDELIEQVTVWLHLVKVLQYELTEAACHTRRQSELRRDLADLDALSLQALSSCSGPDAPARVMVRREELGRIHSSDTEADKVVVRDHFADRAGYVDFRRLYATWHRNITLVYRGLVRLHRLEQLQGVQESRLDEQVAAIERHFADTFLLSVGSWQLPAANLVDAGDANLKFQLEVFVDDVVREQFQRDERVVTELLMEIDRIRSVYLASLQRSEGAAA